MKKLERIKITIEIQNEERLEFYRDSPVSIIAADSLHEHLASVAHGLLDELIEIAESEKNDNKRL